MKQCSILFYFGQRVLLSFFQQNSHTRDQFIYLVTSLTALCSVKT